MKFDVRIYRRREIPANRRRTSRRQWGAERSLEVHRLASSMFTPPQNLSSFICLTITNLLCTRSIHFFAPFAFALPLYPLLSPPPLPPRPSALFPLILHGGHKSPFCCFSGLALRSSPPPPLLLLRLTAGARPRLTFVISNPAGSAHNKERSKLSLRPNPTTPFSDGAPLALLSSFLPSLSLF